MMEMENQPIYRKPLFISIVLHVFLFLVFALGFQFTGKTYVVENSNTPNIVNAMVMSSQSTPKVMPPTPVPVKTPPPPTQAVAPPAKPKVVPPPPKPDVIAIDNKKQKQLQQQQIEKQLLADLHKTKIKQKTLKQQALENAFENEIKNLKVKQQSSQRIAGERDQKARGEVDKYKALVLQVIGRHWIIPTNVDKNLATKIVIFLAPGGMVLDAEIYESSGNTALDNSARAAVFKASPLPVPSDPEAFKFFRRFVLVFRPIYFQKGGFDVGAADNM
jgi:TonB family protein